jgi:hypothetical protein
MTVDIFYFFSDAPKEDKLIVKRDSVPRLFIEGPSGKSICHQFYVCIIILDVLLTGSTTPLIEAATTDNNDEDERSNKSRSNTQDLHIDDKSKENLENKLNRNNDELETEHRKNKCFLKNNTSTFVLAFQIADSPVPSNTPTQESSSSDDITDIPLSTLRSTESLNTDKTDDQQPNTQLIVNKRFSRPKILIEDVQSK